MMASEWVLLILLSPFIFVAGILIMILLVMGILSMFAIMMGLIAFVIDSIKDLFR